MIKKKKNQEFYLPTSLLQDPTKEPLSVILTPYQGITHVPFDVGSGDTATLVFVKLQDCFKKAGFVAEGLLPNVIWGFEQCGYDPRAAASGLSRLRELGYLFYSDDRGEKIFEFDYDPKKPVWVRYTQKMKDLFIRSSIIMP